MSAKCGYGILIVAVLVLIDSQIITGAYTGSSRGSSGYGQVEQRPAANGYGQQQRNVDGKYDVPRYAQAQRAAGEGYGYDSQQRDAGNIQKDPASYVQYQRNVDYANGYGEEINQQSGQEYRRAATEQESTAGGAKKPSEVSWTPVREAKEFSAFVGDKIEGAHVVREEKWNNGTMTGSYAQPVGNGKWDIVTYIADDKGYRITNKKTVDESQLPEIQASLASKDKHAQININQNGAKTDYRVTPDQIAKNTENKNQAQNPEQKKQ